MAPLRVPIFFQLAKRPRGKVAIGSEATFDQI